MTANQLERLCDKAAAKGEYLETLLMIARPRLIRLVKVRMSDQLARRLDADDVVQETLVTAAKRFDEFKNSRSVPVFVWLRGLAIERLIEANRYHLRAAKRAASQDVSKQDWLNQSSLDLLERWVSQGKSPSQVVADRQRSEDLNQVLQELPENYREVIVLRFFESLTIAETAAAIGITIPNAKVLQFRALKRMEKLMTASRGWKSADRKV